MMHLQELNNTRVLTEADQVNEIKTNLNIPICVFDFFFRDAKKL